MVCMVKVMVDRDWLPKMREEMDEQEARRSDEVNEWKRNGRVRMTCYRERISRNSGHRPHYHSY